MKYTEISHFSHPKHNLKFEYTEAPFKCDGCKEAGIGSRYKCAGASGGGGGGGGYYGGGGAYYNNNGGGVCCNFDLHTHCAIPSTSISHPFYTKCSFQFLSRPPGEVARYCNACEKDVTGFVYHCYSCGFDLHPCCAKLPMMLLDDGEIKLFLYKKVSAPCLRCGRKGRSWSYRSSCKKYNLHVACAKEMLVESWHDIYHGSSYTGSRKLDGRIPSLKGAMQAHRYNKKSKGKTPKGFEIAALALQFVISAVLGDPTAIIAALIGTLISSK